MAHGVATNADAIGFDSSAAFDAELFIITHDGKDPSVAALNGAQTRVSFPHLLLFVGGLFIAGLRRSDKLRPPMCRVHLFVIFLLLALPLVAQTTPGAPETAVQAPTPISSSISQQPTAPPITIESATQAALKQATAYQQAVIDEQTAALDLTQARASLLPRVRDSFTATYNKPIRPGSTDPSFIAANAVREYQNLLGVEGSLDFGARAAIARNRALLAAAHAGTEIARRALVRGVREAYFGLGLATAKRRSAEETLAAAEEFERVTALQQSGGELAEVDVIRARLQTAQRRDDAEQARLQEANALAAMRVLVGIRAPEPLSVADLTPQPSAADVEWFTAEKIGTRPELTQAEQQLRAARSDVGVARAGRLPALTYSVDEGFDAASLHASDIQQHRGYLAMANLNIPIFDWGIGRAKQRQAELHAQAAENQLAMTRRETEQAFRIAHEEALTAVRRVDNARGAVADARRNADISIARYRAGEAPILEVTDALTTLAQQRSNYQQALYDFEIARAHLQEAAGE
ncbi:MAG: outer membrane protein [Thermoanaerobaculia bacterium]|nr:outer membrane protein [Thermoanaerobaculia bacterium]